jgi:tRNA G18 (ribose-2'-O)-methylase SpoU
MIVIAHNIRSLHNVGSIFRSADAFGVEKLYLTGFTGAPPRAEISKTALGSEGRVSWEHRSDIFRVIGDLRAQGHSIIGLETGERAVPIHACQAATNAVIVLGNEVSGIEPEVLPHLDQLLEIPMPGAKRSLNVAVAAGIALFVFSQKA